MTKCQKMLTNCQVNLAAQLAIETQLQLESLLYDRVESPL